MTASRGRPSRRKTSGGRAGFGYDVRDTTEKRWLAPGVGHLQLIAHPEVGQPFERSGSEHSGVQVACDHGRACLCTRGGTSGEPPQDGRPIRQLQGAQGEHAHRGRKRCYSARSPRFRGRHGGRAHTDDALREDLR
jgi:hypothetical protein